MKTMDEGLEIWVTGDKSFFQPEHLMQLAKEVIRLRTMTDRLLAHCPDGECYECGEIVCPHNEPLHFHHDGCPCCCRDEDEQHG